MNPYVCAGVLFLAIFAIIGYSLLHLAGEIDQEREDNYGERRS